MVGQSWCVVDGVHIPKEDKPERATAIKNQHATEVSVWSSHNPNQPIEVEGGRLSPVQSVRKAQYPGAHPIKLCCFTKYTWRHNQVVKVISGAAQKQCKAQIQKADVQEIQFVAAGWKPNKLPRVEQGCLLS